MPYVEALEPGFTVLRDKDHKISAAYNIPAIPAMIVIDKKGMVAFAGVGGGLYLEEAVKAVDKEL